MTIRARTRQSVFMPGIAGLVTKLGEVFYDGAAARADPMIDQWKRETAYEEKP
jgi:hypothetical protein